MIRTIDFDKENSYICEECKLILEDTPIKINDMNYCYRCVYEREENGEIE